VIDRQIDSDNNHLSVCVDNICFNQNTHHLYHINSHIQSLIFIQQREGLVELEAMNISLSSQLTEARFKLSEVEKNYKLLSGDQDALSNISLEQCDELILTLCRCQEKLLQQLKRVSDKIYIEISNTLSRCIYSFLIAN